MTTEFLTTVVTKMHRGSGYTNTKQEAEEVRVNERQYRAAVWRLLTRDSRDILMEVLLVVGPPKDWGDSGQWFDGCCDYLADRYGWKRSAKQTSAACEILFARIEQMLWSAENESEHVERKARR